jgi:rubrerythrin
MPSAKNAGDVFSMAMGMEQIGKNFYQALAEGSDNLKVREFCVRTAAEEAKHYDRFREMREHWLMATHAHRIAPEQAEALAAVAKAQIQPDAKQVHKVAIGGNLADALHLAIQMEQDAIRFYGEMLTSLPDSAESIHEIVAEETRHLNSLRVLAL